MIAARLERDISGEVSLDTVDSLQCEACREGAVVAALRIAGKGEACRLSQHRLAECNLVDRETPQAELQGKVEKSAQFRSEEHTSELQSLMRISYAVFCLKKKTNTEENTKKRLKQKRQYRTHV